MLNHIELMGRLTRDPELRYTRSNTPVAYFSIAVDRDAKGQSGTRATDFIDCVAWRNNAEFIRKYFFKGDMICVTGRLQIREWTDRDDNKRKSAEVNIETAYFTGAKRAGEKPVDEAPDDIPYSGSFSELADDEYGELPY